MVRSLWRVVLVYIVLSVVIGTLFFILAPRGDHGNAETYDPDIQALSTASFNELEDAYYERTEKIHVHCNPVERIGRQADGGWDVCMAPDFRPKKGCLMYSFGVNYIWEFDELMAEDHGCTVRAFDPSMSDSHHVHYPGPVYFYEFGLGGSNKILEETGWQLHTFDTTLALFNDSHKVIDLVKIDIEYSEWETLENMIASNAMSRIKQLIFETHTMELDSKIITNREEYLRYIKVLDGLERKGFRRYYYHANRKDGVEPVYNARWYKKDMTMIRSVLLGRTCCYELYYINMNYAKEMTGITLL